MNAHLNVPSSHLSYWLAAVYLSRIEPRIFLQLLENFADIEKLFTANTDELRNAGGTPQQIAAIKEPDWVSVARDIAWAQSPLHHLITITDAAYPRLLKEIDNPPLVLYVQGNKEALATMQLAIVGSRHATPGGLKNAESFASALVLAGFAITSGFALGIDTSSHRGALKAKGITIGVAGTGLHHIYPAANRALVEEIIDHHGAIISEFPLYSESKAHHFPRRNRIISGLSIGVLVVEAALKSGSLITARLALEQGREVFAIPGSIHNPLTRGCHHLIRQGASLVESVDDILAELNILRSLERNPLSPPPRPKLTSNQSFLLNLIAYEITPMNVIILRSGLTAGEVSSTLLELELNGYIQSVTGGYMRIEEHIEKR